MRPLGTTPGTSPQLVSSSSLACSARAVILSLLPYWVSLVSCFCFSVLDSLCMTLSCHNSSSLLLPLLLACIAPPLYSLHCASVAPCLLCTVSPRAVLLLLDCGEKEEEGGREVVVVVVVVVWWWWREEGERGRRGKEEEEEEGGKEGRLADAVFATELHRNPPTAGADFRRASATLAPFPLRLVLATVAKNALPCPCLTLSMALAWLCQEWT